MDGAALVPEPKQQTTVPPGVFRIFFDDLCAVYHPIGGSFRQV